MQAILALVLLVVAIANPVAAVAFAVFVYGFVVFVRVADATDSSFLAVLALWVWWGGLTVIGVRLQKLEDRSWYPVAKEILGNAHLAGVCLFWVGFIALELLAPSFDEWRRQHDGAAMLLSYGVTFLSALLILSARGLSRYVVERARRRSTDSVPTP